MIRKGDQIVDEFSKRAKVVRVDPKYVTVQYYYGNGLTDARTRLLKATVSKYDPTKPWYSTDDKNLVS